MSSEKKLKQRIKSISTEVIRLYHEAESQKKRVVSFTEEIIAYEQILLRNLDSINDMVDKNMISDADGVLMINEISGGAKEYTNLMNRYSAWLQGDNEAAQKLNQFEKENHATPYTDAYHEGKLTLKEYVEKFESILAAYTPIANRVISSRSQLESFQNEFRQLTRKANSSVN